MVQCLLLLTGFVVQDAELEMQLSTLIEAESALQCGDGLGECTKTFIRLCQRQQGWKIGFQQCGFLERRGSIAEFTQVKVEVSKGHGHPMTVCGRLQLCEQGYVL